MAAALTRQGTPRLLPVYDTLDKALAHARSRPPFLRERLRLATTLEAFTTAGSFAGEVCIQQLRQGRLAEAIVANFLGVSLGRITLSFTRWPSPCYPAGQGACSNSTTTWDASDRG